MAHQREVPSAPFFVELPPTRETLRGPSSSFSSSSTSAPNAPSTAPTSNSFSFPAPSSSRRPSTTSSSSASHHHESADSADSGFNFQAFQEKLRQRAAFDIVKAITSFINENKSKDAPVEKTTSGYHTFVSHMASVFRRHELWKKASEAELDHAMEGLEMYLTKALYGHYFPAQSSDEAHKDNVLSERMNLLSFLEPQHLDIARDTCNWDLVPQAMSELKRMDACQAPREKVACIMAAASIVVRALSVGGTVSADRLQPLLIYVTLKANPSRLFSNLTFIQRFRNPEKLSGEVAYYLTHMMGAVVFIERMDGNQLSIDPSAFDAGLSRSLEQRSNSATPLVSSHSSPPPESAGIAMFGGAPGVNSPTCSLPLAQDSSHPSAFSPVSSFSSTSSASSSSHALTLPSIPAGTATPTLAPVTIIASNNSPSSSFSGPNPMLSFSPSSTNPAAPSFAQGPSSSSHPATFSSPSSSLEAQNRKHASPSSTSVSRPTTSTTTTTTSSSASASGGHASSNLKTSASFHHSSSSNISSSSTHEPSTILSTSAAAGSTATGAPASAAAAAYMSSSAYPSAQLLPTYSTPSGDYCLSPTAVKNATCKMSSLFSWALDPFREADTTTHAASLNSMSSSSAFSLAGGTSMASNSGSKSTSSTAVRGGPFAQIAPGVAPLFATSSGSSIASSHAAPWPGTTDAFSSTSSTTAATTAVDPMSVSSSAATQHSLSGSAFPTSAHGLASSVSAPSIPHAVGGPTFDLAQLDPCGPSGSGSGSMEPSACSTPILPFTMPTSSPSMAAPASETLLQQQHVHAHAHAHTHAHSHSHAHNQAAELLVQQPSLHWQQQHAQHQHSHLQHHQHNQQLQQQQQQQQQQQPLHRSPSSRSSRAATTPSSTGPGSHLLDAPQPPGSPASLASLSLYAGDTVSEPMLRSRASSGRSVGSACHVSGSIVTVPPSSSGVASGAGTPAGSSSANSVARANSHEFPSTSSSCSSSSSSYCPAPSLSSMVQACMQPRQDAHSRLSAEAAGDPFRNASPAQLMAAGMEPPVQRFLNYTVEELSMNDIPLLLADYKRLAALNDRLCKTLSLNLSM